MDSEPYQKHDFYLILHESSVGSDNEIDARPCKKHDFNIIFICSFKASHFWVHIYIINKQGEFSSLTILLNTSVKKISPCHLPGLATIVVVVGVVVVIVVVVVVVVVVVMVVVVYYYQQQQLQQQQSSIKTVKERTLGGRRLEHSA